MVATKMINFLYLRLLKKLFWPKSHFEGALDRFLVKPSEGTGGARRDRTADNPLFSAILSNYFDILTLNSKKCVTGCVTKITPR